MVILMVNLGFWQLRRHDERRAANAETAATLARDPVDLAGLLTAGDLPPDYTAVTAAGRYVEGAEVLIANRSFEGQAGSWLATPLRFNPAPADGEFDPDEGSASSPVVSPADGEPNPADNSASSPVVSPADGEPNLAEGSVSSPGVFPAGRVVMVVRGWVPRLHVAGVDQRPAGPPPGPVSVTGLAFASVGGGRIGVTDPGETPEISRPDLDRYREVTGLDPAPVWIRLRAQNPPLGELPIPVPPPTLSDGPHLSYAFQWFFFSVGAAVVYGLILRRFRRDPLPGNGSAQRAPVA